MKLALLVDKADADRVARLLRGDAQILWSASSLSEAAALLRSSRPDALLASAPKLRGASGLASLGAPVIVLRSTAPSDASLTYEAMNAGAVYALQLPPGELSPERRQSALRSLRLAASPGSPTPTPGPPQASHDAEIHRRAPSPSAPVRPAAWPAQVIALGASTGGPPALGEVLKALHPTNATVLIVQHLDPEFVPDLASWLARHSGMPVDLSSATTELRPGRALVAATSQHLVATASGLRHLPPAPADIHHPSVDALFRSLAAHAPAGAAALLTGMGRDGAEGLLALRRAGFRTAAQDAASSAVDGMPRAAREAGAAEVALPLAQIGPWLRQALGGRP